MLSGIQYWLLFFGCVDDSFSWRFIVGPEERALWVLALALVAANAEDTDFGRGPGLDPEKSLVGVGVEDEP